MAGDFTTADDTTESGCGADADDPRRDGEYVRVIEGASVSTASDGDDAGEVTLVGVVHDHPASVYRARTVARERSPDALALELPPLAVPLFERYARGEVTDASEHEPPSTGGEMSAAIRAADAEHTAGIDGPTVGFGARLARTLIDDGATLSTVGATVSRFVKASAHAVRCRLAAVLASATGHERKLSAPRTHAVSTADPPAEQVRDERRQVRLARSVAAAFGADRAVATRDSTREAHMADRIATMATRGDVVAVLGVDHLDPVAERLVGRC